MVIQAALTLLGGALLVAAAVLHAFGLYGVVLVVLGGLRRRTARASVRGVRPRIAALVVAHDEERVVETSVRSLMAQRYPAELWTVFVVADRCTDRTAAVARAAGAVVLERRPGEAPGKSAAVAWGIEAIARHAEGAERAFDAVAVFDADNHVDAEFTGRIAARLEDGETVVQGFVDATNAAASWVAGSSALGFWSIAAVAQAPRERVGLSTPLMGTGFVMTLESARRFLGDATSLTDDLALGARLALAGVRVAFEEGARTIDEKPVELGTAVAQRHRWMQGRWAVAEKNVPRLLAGAFGRNGGSPGERLRRWDVAVQLVAPSLLFTGVALAAVATVVAILSACGLAAAADLAALVPVPVSFLAAALFYLLPGLLIVKFRPPPRVWLCYLVQPVYLALSVPLAATGFFARHERTWKRTPKGLHRPAR